ncbi:hypothetical protein MPH_03679 [Macrophomina phaseolina MS6]|uniref:Uncharacterized protein n=1 Tax=Macrophomina phaseolina (strain MS6) TaxID=1126212 RepID=K2S9B7_MACPH|nr:hypothetical protein MPH_03679 [Macrophomina phaseolina MS6]
MSIPPHSPEAPGQQQSKPKPRGGLNELTHDHPFRTALPTFEPSSSPELTALLDTARARLMVPAHLNLAQQHLVYRDAHRARLDPATNPEPYYSTVAGADVALEHLDRQRDIPARWSVFSRALALAETRTDWENVGRLLEGLRDAGVVLKDTWVQNSKPLNRYQRFAQATHKLRRLVPVWHGLTLAQRVLGDSMPLRTVDTYRKIGELREEIQRAIDTMQANLREGQSVDNHADYQAWAAVKAEYEA